MVWYHADLTQTRERILYAAFMEVHANGFQAASIQNIINAAGVTKGALYHYFDSKNAIGHALVDEVFTQYIDATFVKSLANTDDPIASLIESLLAFKDNMTDADIGLGCPFDSFTSEMAPIDPALRKSVEALRQNKQITMEAAFLRGQAAGTVSLEVDAHSLALMVCAMMHGCMGIAKSACSVETLMQYGQPMIDYLQNLRLQS
ncbi:MAG: TetR/AcrR family transcriptional repressor of nem operon [Saprospiraceae bacterium]|jgi:TetR/AcrR family transcriptional repressor of nem operon